MNQRSRITGHTAPTTPNADEALRRTIATPRRLIAAGIKRGNERLTHPLFALISDSQLNGDLVQVIEAGDGLVTVIATPDSEWGAYEITGWRHLSEAETAIEVAASAFPGEPFDLVTRTSSAFAQNDTEIDARVANAVNWLTTRLAEVAA